MKKIMKLALGAALTFSAGLSLTACGKSSDKIVVGTNAAFAPFEFKDGEKIVGFDMDLMREYGKWAGKEVVINDMEFDAALASAATGKIDVAAAGITVNETRKKTLSFSNSYYTSTQVVTVKKGSELETTLTSIATTTTDADALYDAIVDALAGKKIGCQNATTGHFLAGGNEDWGFDGIEKATVSPYSNGALAMKDLNDGKLDAVILDEEPSKAIISKSYSTTLSMIDASLTTEDYAIAVKKDNTELVDSLNKFLVYAKENGIIDELLTKYFG